MHAGDKTKPILSWALALALAVIFGLAGGWKLYAPAQAARQQVALGLPAEWATPLVILLGALELLAAGLILLPPFRRWGALLAAGLAVMFLLYVGINYSSVKGKECGCLPGRRGSIGAGFFVEDGLLLAAAAATAASSPRARWRARHAAGVSAALALLIGLGWASSRLDQPLFARRQPLALQMMDRSARFYQHTFSPGERFLLYFQNPTCGSCLLAAENLKKLSFSAPLVVLTSAELESAYRYLDQVGLREAQVSTDFEPLVRRLDVERIPSLFLMDGAEPRAVVVDFREPQLSRRLRELGVLQ